ncbi:MAG: serine/threonine-protein kinase [Phycisphaerales bacterium]|nr:serine/threonine-protein kinase [Phycisphaerales bacterium]
MDSDRHDHIGQLFLEARELPASERGAFLDEACNGDRELKREVESLLACEADDLNLEQVPGLDVRAGVTDLDKRLKEEAVAEAANLPTRIGKYQIVRKLGEGGMGIVYLAEQSHPRRRVALKVIRPGWASDRLIRRFLNEAEVLGQLQHPGIAQIYEAGTAKMEATSGASEAEQPFFAMEYIEGLPLNRYIARKQLNVRQQLELIANICDAVHHAHTKGVVHRDLKPSNILIVDEGTKDSRDLGTKGEEEADSHSAPRPLGPSVPSSVQPKILDFGVARVTDADIQITTLQTDVGQLIGTIPYMSPEQIEGDSSHLDQRSDVYALGVICYECLAGKLPHELRNASIPEVARLIREEEPSRLSSVNSVFRGDIETIVAKALEKEKERRYASAAELAADIRRHLEHRAIIARPTTAAYRLRKFAKRNKVLVGGIVSVFIVLLAGIFVSTSMYLKAEDARVEAQDNLTLAEEREQEATEARDQLQVVVDFQSSMLSEIDARQMGRSIVADQRNHIRKRLEKEGRSSEEIEAAVTSFNKLATLVNATDLALEVVDEHVLSRAMETIDQEFAHQPLVSAALRQTVANAYHEIGLDESAMPLQEAALRTRREQLGNEHPDTLSSINRMGLLHRSMGDYPEAESYYREALENRRRVLGDNHADTLQSMANVASILIDQGKYDDAEKAAISARDRSREHLGEEHNRTLEATYVLAQVYDKRGRHDQSEPLHLRVVDLRRKTLGDKHSKTVDALNNLAGWYWDNGRYDEAEKLYVEILETRRRTLGEEHPKTLRSTNNLGTLYHKQGQYEKARKIYTGSLELHRRVLGAEHPDTLILLSNIATLHVQSRDPKSAIALFEEMLEIRKRISGPHHPDTLFTMNNLAHAYSRIPGRLEDAERVNREVLAIRREVLGDDHPDTLTSLCNLASQLVTQKKYEEAEPLHLEAVEIADRAFEPNHPAALFALKNLAELYGMTDRLDHAIPIYIDVVDRHGKKFGDAHFKTMTLKHGLANCYQRMRRYDEAKPLLTEVAKDARTSLPTNHWMTGQVLTSLGNCHVALKEYTEAEATLIESHAILTKAVGPRHSYSRAAVKSLVRLYEDWGKSNKADEWQTKLPPTVKP